MDFCPKALTPEEYGLLSVADLVFGGEIAKILNANGHASWTCCPHCLMEDFTHVVDCPVGSAAEFSMEFLKARIREGETDG